jgi:choice-of-anchor C domain-containing protein
MSNLKNLAVMAVFALSANAANAASIANGSFELTGPGAAPGGNYTSVNAGDSTSITGWTVTAGSVDLIGGYWLASHGSNSLDMDGGSTGAISQTFTTVIGQAYTVGFDFAGNPTGDVKSMGVQATGTAQQIFAFDTAGHGTSAMGWVHESYGFTATSQLTALTFTSLSDGASGPALDNVSITSGAGAGAVPEPATWMMLMSGFGIVGAGLRSRRRDTVTA